MIPASTACSSHCSPLMTLHIKPCIPSFCRIFGNHNRKKTRPWFWLEKNSQHPHVSCCNNWSSHHHPHSQVNLQRRCCCSSLKESPFMFLLQSSSIRMQLQREDNGWQKRSEKSVPRTQDSLTRKDPAKGLLIRVEQGTPGSLFVKP